MPGPMDGVKIVDLSIALAGPWAVGILADQGASVIKVEPPGLGDIGRWVGVAVGGLSAMAALANRGKRSIAVDLQTDSGREIVAELAARADVFVQNFRPGVIERLGLSYETLHARNPDLIYCSISGFGREGPYATKSAYDPVVQAYGGLAFAQAGGEDPEPQLIRHTAADKITALTASQAITAALFARERGAGGQHLELAMLECVVNFVWADAAGNEVLLDADGSQPSAFARDQKLWPTRDGHVIADEPALEALRTRLAVPVVGMEPPLKPAVAGSARRHVAVLVTPATARGARLARLAEAHADRCRREYTRECPRVPESTRDCARLGVRGPAPAQQPARPRGPLPPHPRLHARRHERGSARRRIPRAVRLCPRRATPRPWR